MSAGAQQVCRRTASNTVQEHARLAVARRRGRAGVLRCVALVLQSLALVVHSASVCCAAARLLRSQRFHSTRVNIQDAWVYTYSAHGVWANMPCCLQPPPRDHLNPPPSRGHGAKRAFEQRAKHPPAPSWRPCSSMTTHLAAAETQERRALEHLSPGCSSHVSTRLHTSVCLSPGRLSARPLTSSSPNCSCHHPSRCYPPPVHTHTNTQSSQPLPPRHLHVLPHALARALAHTSRELRQNSARTHARARAHTHTHLRLRQE